jgi:N-glycosylase/DNA lyase
MAAVVDKDFYPNRRLLRTLHRVDPGSVGHSKLFTCFVLNVQDFKEYIRRLKAVFIRYVEDTVNNYLKEVSTSITKIKDALFNDRKTIVMAVQIALYKA